MKKRLHSLLIPFLNYGSTITMDKVHFFFWLTLLSEAQSSLPIKNVPSQTGYSNLDKVGVCSARIGYI